ncbi:MAG: hypothetical protein ACTSRI_16830 [Promethearchaeota archaeon]
MIATEAVEGGARDHYFDEYRNREFIPPKPRIEQSLTETKLPPIEYNLELIKNPDGSYEWVE